MVSVVRGRELGGTRKIFGMKSPVSHFKDKVTSKLFPEVQMGHIRPYGRVRKNWQLNKVFVAFKFCGLRWSF
jgi:hypothetical protein